MTIGRYLLIDRAAQIQIPDNSRRAQIKVLADQLCQDLIGYLAGSVCIYMNGYRLRDTNRIGQLQLAFFREACRYDVLSRVSCRVCRAAVYLGRILTGEGAAAVTGVAAIGVDNDLATGQTGIGRGVRPRQNVLWD